MGLALLRLGDVWVWYRGGVGAALRGATLEADRGELVALVGPNGGGKTTVLRVAAGLVPHYYPARVEGRVEVDGVDPRVEPVAGARAGFLQADPEVQVAGSTVYHEAALGPSLAGLPPRVVEGRAWEALRLLGMERHAWRATHTLSSGLLERAALAGVLSLAAPLLLLDEPTSHLDPWAAPAVAGLLSALAQRGLGVVAATHDPRVAGAADRVYTVEGGRVRPGGRVEEPMPPRRPRGRRGGRVVLYMEGVEAGYPGGGGPVVRVDSLTVREGELVALVGPNGGGKTTVLRVAAGVLGARGRVERRARAAYLPSSPLLVFSKPTARAAMGGRRPPPWLPQAILDRPVYTLSRGELQLAALAVVAASGARLLLLDEPTTGLDPSSRRAVVDALASLADGGVGVLAATHDPLVAGTADRVYRVEAGAVVEE